MFSGPKKPYSAITVQVERLTSEQYEENELSGIVDLVEVIRLQGSGPTEAARAIRKKLKYGNVHRQLRALTILDGLIQNAGSRFQRAFADEPLLERLRVAGTDPLSDADVRAKCKILFGQWSVAYKNTPGMEGIVALYKQLPQRKKPRTQQSSQVIRETEAEAEEEPMGHSVSVSGGSGPTRPLTYHTASSSTGPVTLSQTSNLTSSAKSKSSKEKKSKAKAFNLEKEKPQMLQTLASSSIASTNLMNALKLINRENKRVSEDPEVLKRFETCKVLRRQILRYIQHVESEQWLGGLINANEGLVEALMAYEILDKSVEDDSDSEDEEWDATPAPALAQRTSGQRDTQEAMAGLSLGGRNAPAKPPRPGMSIPMPPPPQISKNGKGNFEDSGSEEGEDQEDDDDPFGDRNAVNTPRAERPGMTWREV
ncbi:MAG: putative actin patch assembly and actin polymerization protein [Pycnora praestabilis]|nr:MAG: putative actin patch assembly and actin polymerization protein [Pycnora praestabilis]